MNDSRPHTQGYQKDQQRLLGAFQKAVDQRDRLQRILEQRDVHLSMIDQHLRDGGEPAPASQRDFGLKVV